VFPELPADHQKPTYFCGEENVKVSADGDGADGYMEGLPPTVGVSLVVVAPPHTDDNPFAILHEPVKVPSGLDGKGLQEVHELKVSTEAFAELGGP
jgi:hypothetical protein